MELTPADAILNSASPEVDVSAASKALRATA